MTTYVPGRPPDNPEDLPAYLYEELKRIEDAMRGTQTVPMINFEILHAEPDRYQEGDIVYADGTDWNPGGTGKGLYQYTGSAWSKL